MTVFLDLFDQFRYITGLLLVLVMLCREALPHRARYGARLAAGYLTALGLALAFVPLRYALGETMISYPILTAPYWLAMSLVPVGYILLCYETNLAGALFRTLLAASAENFITILIRYLLVLRLFPDLPANHPAAYILLVLALYAGFLALTYYVLCSRVRTDESGRYPNPRSTAARYILIYAIYTAILSTTKTICEFLILPLGEAAAYGRIFRYLQNFLIADMFLISVVMSIILYSVYTVTALQNENQIITQMVRARQSQYEFSKENIEMINRKAHDLKHQLLALELASDEERRAQLREARKAVDFYDAVVKTGNETLDILLTEKSVYCQNRSIRLSCMVHAQRLDRIGVVDLYTLLGNAVDNAIESVDQLEDPEKKVISLAIQDQGQMLYIHIENYYDGVLRVERGIPLTRKRDRENHGFGVKSIRSIARKYGGEAIIRAEGQVFSLEILLPA